MKGFCPSFFLYNYRKILYPLFILKFSVKISNLNIRAFHELAFLFRIFYPFKFPFYCFSYPPTAWSKCRHSLSVHFLANIIRQCNGYSLHILAFCFNILWLVFTHMIPINMIYDLNMQYGKFNVKTIFSYGLTFFYVDIMCHFAS